MGTKSYIQRKEADTSASASKSNGKSMPAKTNYPSVVQLKEQNTPANRTGLPDNLKSGIESLSGISLDDVKVHYNSEKPAELNAFAYAEENDIHVAPGQESHLPHEAWHVVQQAQGRVRPTARRRPTPLSGPPALPTPLVTPTLTIPPVAPITTVPINADTSLEREASTMGAKAAVRSRFSRW